MSRAHHTRSLVVMAACALAAWARGDGGVPVASVSAPSGTRTLLMRPAEARVGPMEFTVLGSLGDGEVVLVRRAQQGEAVVMPWAPSATPGVHASPVEFDASGEWIVAVGVPGSPPTLEASIMVGPAAPAWTARLPWLFAWVPLVVLVALRNRAISYTATRTRA